MNRQWFPRFSSPAFLNAQNIAHHFVSLRSLLVYKQASCLCSSEEEWGGVVVLRGGLSENRGTGGAELQGGGGIARAGGTASDYQRFAEMRRSPRDAVRDR